MERVERLESESIEIKQAFERLLERVEVLKAKTRDSREAPMGDTVDEMLRRDEFRGLWRGVKCLESDGSSTVGWKVTFLYGGEYSETPYQASAYGACAYALDLLQKVGAHHVPASDAS